MNIKWSRLAKSDLREIFDYYKEKATRTTALVMKRKIMARVLTLKEFPEMGQKETMLPHLKKEYRYLIEGNYKIIYLVVKRTIIVMTVFDTRRNPKNLKVAL